jgi:hypothetical protein
MTSALLRRYSGFSYLYSDFASEISELILAIAQEGMPFFLYETYRTPQRQMSLRREGYGTHSDVYMNAHVNGLAVDFLFDKRAVKVLNSDSRTIQEIVEDTLNKDSDTDNGNEVYNLGTNLIPEHGKKTRTIVQDQLVLNSWVKLGSLIERNFPKLMWGGNRDIKKGQLIGVDPPHVEFRESKNLIRSKIAIAEIRTRGAPGLELRGRKYL